MNSELVSREAMLENLASEGVDYLTSGVSMDEKEWRVWNYQEFIYQNIMRYEFGITNLKALNYSGKPGLYVHPGLIGIHVKVHRAIFNIENSERIAEKNAKLSEEEKEKRRLFAEESKRIAEFQAERDAANPKFVRTSVFDD